MSSATSAAKTFLETRGYDVSSDDDRSLSFLAARGDCLVEVDASGRLLCQFGIDFDELRDLIAGSGTEDLSDDELQRAARYHLQTLIKPYQHGFKAAGFEEEFDVTDDHAVISFTHPLDNNAPEQVVALLGRCVDLLK